MNKDIIRFCKVIATVLFVYSEFEKLIKIKYVSRNEALVLSGWIYTVIMKQINQLGINYTLRALLAVYVFTKIIGKSQIRLPFIGIKR